MRVLPLLIVIALPLGCAGEIGAGSSEGPARDTGVSIRDAQADVEDDEGQDAEVDTDALRDAASDTNGDAATGNDADASIRDTAEDPEPEDASRTDISEDTSPDDIDAVGDSTADSEPDSWNNDTDVPEDAPDLAEDIGSDAPSDTDLGADVTEDTQVEPDTEDVAPPDTDASPPDEAVVVVSGGGNHTCAARADGTAWCWGANNARQLGAQVVGDQLAPVAAVNLVGVTQVSLGYEFSCAMADGGGYCWGAGSSGQLGTGEASTEWTARAIAAAGLVRLASRMGHWHGCALDSNGLGWCWGFNRDGPLGNGTFDTDPHPTPEQVLDLTNLDQLAAGDFHTCALSSTGTVSCWGYNGWGELGRGTLTGTDPNPVPEPIVDLTGVTQIALGHQFSCALDGDRNAWCWGSNGSGQLGSGDNAFKSRPNQVVDIGNLVAISAGRNHACAVASDKTLWCWGRNDENQLGDGSGENKTRPVQVLTGIVGVGLGDHHSCAIADGGELWCWGKNDRGQVGAGLADTPLPPTPIPF